MKNILVVGACGGMGQAICRLLVQKGFMVYGIDYRIDRPIDNVKYYSCDIRKMENVTSVYEQLTQEISELFAIVHVAGVYAMDSLLEMEEARMMRIFDINVLGVYRINKVFLPLLRKNSRIIITTSEVAPLRPLPFNGIYSITKSTLERYAYSLRMEANLLGIHVAIVRPGAVKTPLLNDSMSELDVFCQNTELYKENSKYFKRIVESVEAKSVTPEKLAKVVLKPIQRKKPRYVYKINANFLLKLFNILPSHLQVYLIGRLLRKKK